MKKFLFFVLFLALASYGWADVTRKILEITDINPKTGEQDNIVVKTQWKIDGVEFESLYPKLDGKYYMVSRYSNTQFTNMTKEQKQAFVDKDLDEFAKILIQRTYEQKTGKALVNIENDAVIQANKNLIAGDFSDLVGQEKITKTTTVLMDTNGDGIKDKQYILKSDGTKTEQPYTP